jgi:cysteinyl-tRNA synthetase, unknown class
MTTPIKPFGISRRELGLGSLAGVAGFGLGLSPGSAEASRGLLKSAQSWAYQLQGNVGSIASSGADVVVVDADHMRGAATRLRTKPGGGRRVVIAYVAIGEVETWRGYWKGLSASGRPSWVTSRTQGWAGNYIVHYWEPAWKAIVKERVRQIFAAGFDGLYLDRVDTWENVKAPGGSRQAMIQWVREISSYARSIKSDAAIMVQNGEELLSSAEYVSAIDAIAKEDLFHGVNHDGRRNSAGMVSESVRMLKGAQAKGKTIFVIEYLKGSTADSVRAEIRKQGFVPFFGGRDLSG